MISKCFMRLNKGLLVEDYIVKANSVIENLYNENVFNSYENEDFYIIRIRQASFLIFKNFDFPALFLKRFALKDLLEKYFKYNFFYLIICLYIFNFLSFSYLYLYYRFNYLIYLF